MTLRQIFPLLALFSLVGCDLLGGGGPDGGQGGAPVITSFTAEPSTITAGTSTVLSWTVSGAVTGLELNQGIGSVSGTSFTVTPPTTTTYTLTARNSTGDDTASTTVTVSGTTPPPTTPPPTTPPGTDTTPPSGSFGVSADPQGPFLNDSDGDISSPTDARVLKLDPGDTFYAQVAYGDDVGIAGITVRLANRSPAGLAADLVEGQSVGGFTLVGTVGACDFASRPTNLTCVYEIEVGDDVENITELPDSGGEFAYVFRTNVTDTSGNRSNTPPRGYVTVGEAGGGTPTPPEPEPEPDDNEAPTAAFTVTAQDENTFTFDGTDSSDPEGDTLSYAWSFGDGSTADNSTVTKSYDDADTYSVTLTVTDPEGLDDSTTEEVNVEDDAPPEEPDEGFIIESFLVNGEASVTVEEGDDLEFTWTLSGDEPSFLLLTETVGDDPPNERRIPAGSDSVTLEAEESAVYELSATDGSTEDPPSVEVTVE